MVEYRSIVEPMEGAGVTVVEVGEEAVESKKKDGAKKEFGQF